MNYRSATLSIWGNLTGMCCRSNVVVQSSWDNVTKSEGTFDYKCGKHPTMLGKVIVN